MYSVSKKPNFTMVALLSLAGAVAEKNVDSLLKHISVSSRYICHSHLIQAAQYLCAEIAATGKSLSYTGGEKRVAYYTTTDIPLDLVEAINRMGNGDVVVSCRDVFLFVNDVLRKFYGTPAWLRNYEQELQVAKVDEKSDDTDEDSDVTIGDPEYSPSSSLSHLIGRTKKDNLKRYFLVHGELLAMLLRFCPECGHRLNAAQLKAVGSAAVARFLCGNCDPQVVKEWESREGALQESKKPGSTDLLRYRAQHRSFMRNRHINGGQEPGQESNSVPSDPEVVFAKVRRLLDQYRDAATGLSSPKTAKTKKRRLGNVEIEKSNGEMERSESVKKHNGVSPLYKEVKSESMDDIKECKDGKTVRYVVQELDGLPLNPSHHPAPHNNINSMERERLDQALECPNGDHQDLQRAQQWSNFMECSF